MEELLFRYKDDKYKEFIKKIIPNLDEKRLIGVRKPVLKKIYKQYYKSINFTKELPHKYYEEDIIHSLYICDENDYNNAIMMLDNFLPYVDNWFVCDELKPKVFIKEVYRAKNYLRKIINSNNIYTKRFVIKTLLFNYLEEYFEISDLTLVNNINDDNYYIQMAKAWYFCEAYIKKEKQLIDFVTNNKIDKKVYKIFKQKIYDSKRISECKKMFIKNLLN